VFWGDVLTIGKKSKAQVAKVRQLVFARDNWVCVVAHTFYGSRCSDELTIQHRITRGMGSSARFDEPKHLLSMCAYHNFLDTADSVFRDFCVARGYSVKRWAANEAGVIPVHYSDGWFLLQGNGRAEVSNVEASKLMLEVYGG
jgi:hypothetical protein